MMAATLIRYAGGDMGTRGVFALAGRSWPSLELPWRENKPSRSCIPPGTYRVEIRDSPRFGRVYEIRDVPGRSHVLIHAGNLAGDVDKGFASDVEGCVLVGRDAGTLAGQWAVLASRFALSELMRTADFAPFDLTISEEDF